ncbi:MAG TPA: BTAD domain-containing putative transcriptional regulator [Acidimicrobiales bacterium]|nr:BTAD domain-containing putative transcriptional regulator [Acidimicrobiales bacterium]
MELRILGPLEVEDGGRRLDLGRPKQRALLALLVVHAGEVVSADRLVEELWAGRPPEDAAAALQVQVSRLRRALAAGEGAAATIESRRPGYVLHVGSGHVDAQRFETLLAQGRDLLARGVPDRAAAALDQALALWRGPALVEFADQPFAMSEAARLEELRLVAQEERVEAELALGHHAALAGSLRQLVDEHPLRERLWGQLMVALYRCGRQAEALRAYAELRRQLGEELGIDPAPALQRLEEAVLLQAPELDWSPRSAAAAGPSPLVAPAAAPFPLSAEDGGSPFVGRTGQLEDLMAEWRAARDGGPRLALLAGEPGVGKTRLAMELARAAHGEGAAVLLGHCDEELAVPYQPFAEALGRVLPGLAPEQLDACVGGRGGELVRLVPELADLAPGLPDPVASDPETERYRLFEAVTRTLAALARDRPVVLLLDDLHWAARPTLLLLRHLVLRAEAMPLLAVGTYRDTERSEAGPGLDLVGALGLPPAKVRHLALSGLDAGAVRELIVAATSQPLSDSQVDLVRSIHEGTGGNPFFVGEVVRNLADTGGPAASWSLEATGVPDGVRSVVQRRVSRLSEDAGRLLLVASVIGGHYHLSVLEVAAAVDEDALLAGLEEALAAGLVSEAPGSSLRQRFTHALVRATLYDSLSSARRARLHRAVGEAIERVFAGRLDDHLPELAHHFVAAAELGETDKAVRYSTLAGDRALDLLAHDEAVRHYRSALGLLPPGDTAARADLLMALGEAEKRSGDPAHRRTLLDAAQVAGALGDPQRMARAAVANSRGFWSATYSVDGERVSALEAALAALPPEDDRLRACVLANLAVELVYAGDAHAVRQRSDEALAIARRLGDLPTLAAVLIPRYNTLRGDPGTLPERLANTAELLAVAEALPDPSLRCQGWGWRAMAAMEAADAEEAARCFRAFERLSTELRQPTTRWFTTYLRAGRSLLAGRLDEAEQLSGEAFRLGRAAGHADAELFFSCQRIQLAFERGALDRWERPLRVALARHPESRWFLRSWQALAFCEVDRPEEARPIFDELAAKDFADHPFEPTWLHVMANCAAVCARLGDRDRARLLTELLAPYDGQFVTISSLAYSGAVGHYLGLLAATLGDHRAAVDHFAAAAEVHERMGAPTWLARTRVAWAACLLDQGAVGGREQAGAMVAAARETAAALGLGAVAGRAAALG